MSQKSNSNNISQILTAKQIQHQLEHSEPALCNDLITLNQEYHLNISSTSIILGKTHADGCIEYIWKVPYKKVIASQAQFIKEIKKHLAN